MQPPVLKHRFAAPFSHPELVRARGVLVVHNRPELIDPLTKKSFIVFPLPHDVKEDEIGPLLAHRALVTDNVDLYREAAAIHEFSIIDIANYDHDAPPLAGEISRAWMKLGVKRKQAFVLTLRRDGEPVLRRDRVASLMIDRDIMKRYPDLFDLHGDPRSRPCRSGFSLKGQAGW
jgi:hypothetical protein